MLPTISGEARKRDGVVFVGVAQEKAQAFQGKKIDGHFWFTRDKTVYVNHYYFYIDDADFGPLSSSRCAVYPADEDASNANYTANSMEPTR